MRSTLVLTAFLFACAATALGDNPPLPWTQLSKSTCGVDKFEREHPELNGHGVIVAVLDTGVDMGVLGLTHTPLGFWDQNQYVRSRYPGTELGLSLSELTQMVKDSGYICEACGKDCKDSWTVDHRVKLSDGGEHTKANVRVLCLPCNSSKKHNEHQP